MNLVFIEMRSGVKQTLIHSIKRPKSSNVLPPTTLLLGFPAQEQVQIDFERIRRIAITYKGPNNTREYTMSICISTGMKYHMNRIVAITQTYNTTNPYRKLWVQESLDKRIFTGKTIAIEEKIIYEGREAIQTISIQTISTRLI